MKEIRPPKGGRPNLERGGGFLITLREVAQPDSEKRKSGRKRSYCDNEWGATRGDHYF